LDCNFQLEKKVNINKPVVTIEKVKLCRSNKESLSFSIPPMAGRIFVPGIEAQRIKL
jgi:hypothetical protein